MSSPLLMMSLIVKSPLDEIESLATSPQGASTFWGLFAQETKNANTPINMIICRFKEKMIIFMRIYYFIHLI